MVVTGPTGRSVRITKDEFASLVNPFLLADGQPTITGESIQHMAIQSGAGDLLVTLAGGGTVTIVIPPA